MTEDITIRFPLGRVIRGHSIDKSKPKSKKKPRIPTKYQLFKLKTKIGDLTQPQLIDFLNLSWERIKAYINKPKPIHGFYYIKSTPKQQCQ